MAFDGRRSPPSWSGAPSRCSPCWSRPSSRRKIAGKHSVIDTAWGLLFCAVAVATFVTSGGHGDGVRALAAARAAGAVGTAPGRAHRPAHDRQARGPAVREAAGEGEGQPGPVRAALDLPAAGRARVRDRRADHGRRRSRRTPCGVIAWIGVALWLVGVFFEAVGDAQMERWRADPAHKGKVIDVGLWRYTRHPNYFGDACVWWGIFLVAADRGPAC